MARNRAYRRRMARLKDKRRREMCEYLPFWKNIWFDKLKGRIAYNSGSSYKRYIKSYASRAGRRNPSDQTKGCAYKKQYNVPDLIW